MSKDWNNDPQAGHSFGWGVIMGGMAGVASYYLFGTKEGNELRQKLIKEYEQARDDLSKKIIESEVILTTPVETTITSELAQPLGLSAQLKSFWSSLTHNSATEPSASTSSRRTFTKSGKKL
jgi:gas vesicle protein